MWWVIGGIGFLAVAGIVARLCDMYGQRERGAPGRHANTGEMPVTEHKLADDWKYTTMDSIPKFIEVGPEVQKAPLLNAETTIIHPFPKSPVRTDTVMMEAVDPAMYPDWIKENEGWYRD